MPVQRKVYRIEEMAQGDPSETLPVSTAELAMCHHETLRELKALRDVVENCTAVPAVSDANIDEIRQLRTELHQLYETVKRTKQQIASLHVSGFENGRMTRVNNELGAVVGGTENATHRILSAAEVIDTHAGALVGHLQSEQHANLAQEIQDGVIRIFEACVFHDLTGQRVAKVTAALKVIEDHVARMIEIWGGPEALAEYIAHVTNGHAPSSKLINGPRLGDDIDHVNQKEIDAIFAAFRPD